MESYLTAEISAPAVAHNLALLRGLLKPGVKLCAVVKADAYGHGVDLLLDAICPLVDFLAVATPQEAIYLRQKGCTLPVLTFFSPCALGSESPVREALEEMIARDITITVVSADDVRLLDSAARRVGAVANVHFKIDTGMGRRGMLPGQAGQLAQSLRKHPSVALGGMYTHLACADEADKTSALEQLANFRRALRAVADRKGLIRHAANSAALIDLPDSRLDMVRAGIAMYGYQPSDQMHRRLDLRPALRLRGRLLQINKLPRGSRCGYGLIHIFERDSVVGVAPIGYADGYFRCLSGKAVMRVAGFDVPVCGRVSMDQVIVDLTDVPAAGVGDEVEIISNNPAAENSAENLARLAGTIPYEITCRLGGRIRRVLV